MKKKRKINVKEYPVGLIFINILYNIYKYMLPTTKKKNTSV